MGPLDQDDHDPLYSMYALRTFRRPRSAGVEEIGAVVNRGEHAEIIGTYVEKAVNSELSAAI